MFMDKRIKLLNALSDETRIKIVQALMDSELCACSIYPLVGKAQSTVSQHLKILEESDILESRREGINIWYRIKSNEAIQIMNVMGFTKTKVRQVKC